jgi:hypothetical protein
MLAVKGIYQNGRLILDEEVTTIKPLNVIVTFLDDIPTEVKDKVDINSFHFLSARNICKSLKSSLSDEIIKERREAE